MNRIANEVAADGMRPHPVDCLDGLSELTAIAQGTAEFL